MYNLCWQLFEKLFIFHEIFTFRRKKTAHSRRTYNKNELCLNYFVVSSNDAIAWLIVFSVPLGILIAINLNNFISY